MKLQKISGVLIVASLLIPVLAGAQTQTPPVVQLNISFVMGILTAAVNWLFSIFLIIAVIFLLLAAFKYLTSGGDSAKVGEATKAVIYAAVAIGVALLAASVRFLVQDFLGIGGGAG